MKIPQQRKAKATIASNKSQGATSKQLTVAWYTTALTVTSLETTVIEARRVVKNGEKSS